MSGDNSETITGARARFYNKFMSGLGAERIYEQALSLIKLRAHDRLLDVGCGTGTFLKLLRNNSSIPLVLTGVDVSDDMLREAKRDADDISFQYANALRLPFHDKSFDTVVSILALHHMPNNVKKQAMGEMARVLKRDGKIVILDLLRTSTRLGGYFRFWFNLHSYTRGNWELIVDEITQIGFAAVKEGTVRGFVGYLVAEHSQGGQNLTR